MSDQRIALQQALLVIKQQRPRGAVAIIQFASSNRVEIEITHIHDSSIVGVHNIKGHPMIIPFSQVETVEFI